MSLHEHFAQIGLLCVVCSVQTLHTLDSSVLISLPMYAYVYVPMSAHMHYNVATRTMDAITMLPVY